METTFNAMCSNMHTFKRPIYFIVSVLKSDLITKDVQNIQKLYFSQISAFLTFGPMFDTNITINFVPFVVNAVLPCLYDSGI